MGTSLVNSPTSVRTFSGRRDEDGHRTYKVVSLVRDNGVGGIAGPATVLSTPGLPLVGSVWNFGTDLDIWAFCTPRAEVSIHQEREGDAPPITWRVSQEFTTNPRKRCGDTPIEDPLLEPDRISGTFVKYTKEVTKDRQGRPIKSSSHEIISGPQVEFDFSNATVRIEQNVADLELDLITQLQNRVNDSTLWGLEKRKIKLSNTPWERKYIGECDVYYTRVLEFDVDFEGFDKEPLDEGTKVLNGHWADTIAERDQDQCRSLDEPDPGSLWTLDCIDGSQPDKDNPQHFIQYKDRNGENATVILNGRGEPYTTSVLGTGTGTALYIEDPFILTDEGFVARKVEFYKEADFVAQLGIPTSL